MTLQEIKSKICDLRCELEELSEECFKLWTETEDKRTETLADYLHYELTTAAAHLADLEDTEEETEDAPQDEIDELNDWWCDLDNCTKSEISNIPQPNYNDGGRGDDEYEFTERTDKWWNAQTLERKREIFNDETKWDND